MRSCGLKIVSGGQTGVDQGALDAALEAGIPCGGWCPSGRLDELGRIPERFPVTELDHGSFRERTIKNVQDSDGTLILHSGEIHGGTETTVTTCVEHGKPYRLIDCSQLPPDEAARPAASFVLENRIRVLNVAGPRASEWPEAYDRTLAVVRGMMTFLPGPKEPE